MVRDGHGEEFLHCVYPIGSVLGNFTLSREVVQMAKETMKKVFSIFKKKRPERLAYKKPTEEHMKQVDAYIATRSVEKR